jgi:SAM-dependent methyltransferase
LAKREVTRETVASPAAIRRPEVASDTKVDRPRPNVTDWTKANAEFTDSDARRKWAERDVSWGLWPTPEAELRVLGDVSGLDAVDLGCGTAYFSAWLARRGARVVGVDPTPAQLDTARRMQVEFGLEFPLIQAFAEDVPLPDASLDLAHDEFGASMFADPYRWIPEAHRLLRPGGRLVFMRSTPLLFLCGRDEGGVTEQLVRPMRGMNRIEGRSDRFMLPHSELFRLLRRTGFAVEDLIEVYAPDGARRHEYYSFTRPEWAQKWPAEEIWAARKVR